MQDNTGIQTNKLTKRYPGTTRAAVKNLSLTVKRGEVYGFLGSNGAGKSTTIRVLLNFLQPTSGQALLLGLDSVDDSVQIKQHIGYLSGDVALYPKATGRQLLDYLGQLHGMRLSPYRKTLEQRFAAELDTPIATLSKGNRQKIGVLQALMHQPDVLVLDEPTSGLDPLMQEAFYESITEAKARGAAIFMSSHNLAEAERVCDRVGILKDGVLLREQAVHGSSLGSTVFRVRFAAPEAVKKLQHAHNLRIVSTEADGTVVLQAAPGVAIKDVLRSLSLYDIKDFTTERIDLESEFISYYGEPHEADH
ncbi:MAG TPA: ABC transporter ATP-binding protein [Candidatus Saccharimonadales bacterium]|nr:ABC transporter ATP-binding protein [Candidatus Saccharimonadales bacterium]